MGEGNMTDFDRVTPSPTRTDSTRAAEVPPVAVAPRGTLTTSGPIFSTEDMMAGIVAAVMILGPLAMAAFAVGRH
jgi:hypothetical protein